MVQPPHHVLETVLYAPDLAAAAAFYERVLGLRPYAVRPGRHLFYRLDTQMLLIFNPGATGDAALSGPLPVPTHGALGPGHVCFRASLDEIDRWRAHLAEHGVAIEADFEWPAGGRSIYFRDPAGNSIEFAEPRIWELP